MPKYFNKWSFGFVLACLICNALMLYDIYRIRSQRARYEQQWRVQQAEDIKQLKERHDF